MLTSIFWVVSVQLILCYDEFLLPEFCKVQFCKVHHDVSQFCKVHHGCPARHGEQSEDAPCKPIKRHPAKFVSLSNDSANDYRMVQMAFISVA